MRAPDLRPLRLRLRVAYALLLAAFAGLALRATHLTLAGDLGERMSEVVVLTMSEFGRTIRENGNSGTDHGHATAILALGGPVNGGRVLGRWPGLDPARRFEGRDVAVTTDGVAMAPDSLRLTIGLAAIPVPVVSERTTVLLVVVNNALVR